MKVTHAQKLELYEKGYVQIPGAVPRVMVDAAVKAINHSFGNGIDPALLAPQRRPRRRRLFRALPDCPLRVA